MRLEAEQVQCPYCGEPIEVLIDPGADEGNVGGQRFIEDCPVCCRPIEYRLKPDWTGGAGENLEVRRDDD
jgi:hypothetical protein